MVRSISFTIRVCQTCGLRYPLIKDQGLTERCPACLGETRAVEGGQIDQSSPRKVRQHEMTRNLYVLEDNIRSAWNVGSIFRSADGFDFQHAFLCGITAAPDNPDVRKTALGAEKLVGWSLHKDALEKVKLLQTQGFEIWVLERVEKSIPIETAKFKRGRSPGIVLVVGNEISGVDPGILRVADRLVHIPMRGFKRSFNVAVAFAIAAHTLRSR